MAGATAETGIWPDSAPQMPLKMSLVIVGGEDAVERGLRGADDGDAADELVRTAIDEDAIDDQGHDREGLGAAAIGDGEAGGDVFEKRP